MPDLKDTEMTENTVEPVIAPDKAKEGAKKPRATGRSRKARAEPSPAAKEAPAPKAGSTRKTYTDNDRAHKLNMIERLLAGGQSTLKNAVKKAGISEQTYYHWKKAPKAAAQSDDLKELVKLEEENLRLRKLLADRLRGENAELRKRLGLGK